MADKPYPDKAFDNLRKAFPDKERDTISEIVWNDEDWEAVIPLLGGNIYYDSLSMDWDPKYQIEIPKLVTTETLTQKQVDEIMDAELGRTLEDRKRIIAAAKKRSPKYYSGPET
jgi:hypothetical protein